MLFYSSKILNLVFVTTIVNAINKDDERKPIVYKILERNNKIIIEKEKNSINGSNLHYMKNYLKHNADLEYNIKNILTANKPTNVGLKRHLVRMIVPHGLDTSEGSRLFTNVGTYFKPLVKLHKTKKVKSFNGYPSDNDDSLISFRDVDKIPKLDQIQSELNRMKNFQSDIQRVKSALVGHGLAPRLPSETEHTMQHLSEMDRLTGVVKNPMLKEIFKSKLSALRTQTEKVHASILDMITAANEKSGENLRTDAVAAVADSSGDDAATTEPPTYHLAPGVNITIAPDTDPMELQCPLFPHQTLWSYWKYHHGIYREPCPNGMTLLHNVCTQVLHHN